MWNYKNERQIFKFERLVNPLKDENKSSISEIDVLLRFYSNTIWN